MIKRSSIFVPLRTSDAFLCALPEGLELSKNRLCRPNFVDCKSNQSDYTRLQKKTLKNAVDVKRESELNNANRRRSLTIRKNSFRRASLIDRRKSMSNITPRARKSRQNQNSDLSSQLSCVTTRVTQFLLRKRSRDGALELVIHHKRSPSRRSACTRHHIFNQLRCSIPVQFAQIIDWLTWQQPLGPEQHGVMFRQLRYVKSVTHDFPWAKARLCDLLAMYTQKEGISKEELYPQLNHLYTQVDNEAKERQKKHISFIQAKRHLALRLSIASQLVNGVSILKFGRRGKPHETYLSYELRDPLHLRWYRKNGGKSTQKLSLENLRIVVPHENLILSENQIQVSSDEEECPYTSRKLRQIGLKRRSTLKYLDGCFSIRSKERILQVQVQSAMHRDWLIAGLRDLVQFAAQYKKAKATTLRRM